MIFFNKITTVFIEINDSAKLTPRRQFIFAKIMMLMRPWHFFWNPNILQNSIDFPFFVFYVQTLDKILLMLKKFLDKLLHLSSTRNLTLRQSSSPAIELLRSQLFGSIVRSESICEQLVNRRYSRTLVNAVQCARSKKVWLGENYAFPLEASERHGGEVELEDTSRCGLKRAAKDEKPRIVFPRATKIEKVSKTAD